MLNFGLSQRKKNEISRMYDNIQIKELNSVDKTKQQ